jgi:hypothetical protein
VLIEFPFAQGGFFLYQYATWFLLCVKQISAASRAGMTGRDDKVVSMRYHHHQGKGDEGQQTESIRQEAGSHH